VPGVLVGVMTGRFLNGKRWRSAKESLGVVGRLSSAIGMLALFSVSLITLVIIVVYLLNLPATSPSINFWLTLLAGLWILINLYFEIRDLLHRRTVR
jgi:hypothetical protein